MAALLREVWQVFLLRRGPQDLPWSPPAVVFFTAVLIGLQLAFATYNAMPLGALAARAATTVLILFGATLALLRFRGMANRSSQTLLALAGTEVLFALISMPLLLAVQPHLQSEKPPTAILLVMMAAVFAFFWKLRVNAAIWRQSLEVPVSAAYLLTFGLMLAEAVVLFILVPAPVSGTP